MQDRSLPERIFDAALFVFVPLVVYVLALINWLMDPFKLREKTVRALLPELSRYPSATTRWVAFRFARGGSLVVQLLLFAAGLSAGFFLLRTWQSLEFTSRTTAVACATAFLLVLIWIVGWLGILRAYLLTDATRRALRRRLNQIGLPTCIDCGHNLKGILTGTCPTCGASVPSP